MKKRKKKGRKIVAEATPCHGDQHALVHRVEDGVML